MAGQGESGVRVELRTGKHPLVWFYCSLPELRLDCFHAQFWSIQMPKLYLPNGQLNIAAWRVLAFMAQGPPMPTFCVSRIDALATFQAMCTESNGSPIDVPMLWAIVNILPRLRTDYDVGEGRGSL